MTINSSSIFAGLAQAKITESGSYLPSGFRGKVKVTRCQIVYPREGVPAFVADLEVLESNMAEVKVGEVKNWYQKTGDSFAGAVLAFMAAIFGYNVNIPEQKAKMEAELQPAAPQYAEAATGTQQILSGRVVGVETMKKDTRSGGEFTRHNWYPVV